MNLLCCFEDSSTDSMTKPTVTSSVKSTESKLSEDALELCRKFDKDGNGYLSKSEIREAVGDTMTKREIDELLEKADTDHDGKVDYKEFFKVAFAK